MQHERAPRSCQKRPLFGSELSPVTGFPTSVGGMITSHGMSIPPLPHYYPSLFPPSPFKPPALHPFLPTAPPIPPLTLTLSHNSAFKPSTSNINTFNSINNISNLISNANNSHANNTGSALNFSGTFNTINASQVGSSAVNFSSAADNHTQSTSSSAISYSTSSSVSMQPISMPISSSIPLTPLADSKATINDRIREKPNPLIGSMNYLKSTNNRYGDVAHLSELYRPISTRLGLSLAERGQGSLSGGANEKSAFNPLRWGSEGGAGDEGEVSSSVTVKGPPTPIASPLSSPPVSPVDITPPSSTENFQITNNIKRENSSTVNNICDKTGRVLPPCLNLQQNKESKGAGK